MLFRRAVLLTLYKLSDIVILICSLIIATIGADYIGGIVTSRNLIFAQSQYKILDLIMVIILIESWKIIFKGFNLYRSRRLGNKLEECWGVIKATSLGTCILSVLIIFCQCLNLSTTFILLFWVSSTLLTIAARMSMRLFLVMVRNKGRNLRLIIIIGTNQRAKKFAEEIKQCKELGYKLIGFVDNKYTAAHNRKKLLSDLNHFSEVLNQYVVDEVVIALPIKSYYEQIEEIGKMCIEQGIVVRYLADLFDQQFAKSFVKSNVDYFHESPILTAYNGPEENWSFVLKRVADAVFSFIGLVFLFPFFIIVGILIKFDSHGDVFFIQQRVGYNKRHFKIYKFRTMVNGAEKKQSKFEYLNEMSGPVFKIANDPRMTRIGKILRKTSIDELPQLFTVLKGDMSLVGPRPLPVRDYNGFGEQWHKRRFSIKPGLTCLWQVNGRNKLPFQKWMELDMEYIDNWTLLLDIKILLKTIPSVLRCSGSY